MDTLRDEACPVCGEQEAWDGNECSVCGFVAPPAKFQDPDVDLHKQLDLRDDQTPGGVDVPGLNADTNDLDGDGLDDQTGEPIDDEEAGADDQQPLLVCPVCGFEAEAAHPTSINTEDPQTGSDQEADGPAEGDLCPACGKGLMESGTQAAGQGLDPEADPDAMRDDDEVDPRDQENPEDDPEREQSPDEQVLDRGSDEDPREDPDEEEDDDAADPSQGPRVRRKSAPTR